jgi:multidrug efflux pump
VRWRWSTIGATTGLFAAAIAGFTLVPQSFFPASNRAEVMVDLMLAEGSSYRETEAAVVTLETWLAKDSDVIQTTAYVGGGSPRFYLPLAQQLQSLNFAQLMLETADLEARERVIRRLRAHLATSLPGVRHRVDRLNSGPPVGWPVQFRVRGEDPAVLARIAATVSSIVRDHPHTFDVHDDWREAVSILKLEIDQDRARALGVSSRTIRQTLAGLTSGYQIGSLRDGDELIPIVVRARDVERSDLSEVMQMSVRTDSGASAPLSQFARLRPGGEPGVHWRRNRMPTITVLANLPDEVQPPDVSKSIDHALDPIRAELPTGYSIEAGGAVEESAKSQASIFVNMPVMVVIVLVLLMIQLQHFGRATMVFLTAPLGLIGAVAALLAFGAPFGFTAILGVIALSGMIMRNSVILVDQIDRDIAAGHEITAAIVNASVARFRPIMLTAAAAVLALIPLTRNVFWGPMSIAMMGGLIVATILTLTFLPALYAAWFNAPRTASKPAAFLRPGGLKAAE